MVIKKTVDRKHPYVITKYKVFGILVYSKYEAYGVNR